ncbi:hypothetical protein BUALT_Bualt08G0043800 [Buddleja alternifolia]|uniref:Uncharacterized protein n=1 Tax=Buddleja alternifolia TaxID=168488 RepID=A0AAV6X7M7_9LAMI|nr:hypothetical protein BUALT_Bualt08G0043800 [Buddleja alternifolia]
MSSNRGPGLFSDCGKKAKEVLTKDYSDDRKLVISSQSDTGLALGSTLVKKGGLALGDVAAQYKFNSAALDIKFDTQSNIEVQYFHEHGSLITAVGLNRSPTLNVSATIGTPSFAFGTEASYMVSSGNFSKYDAGFSLKTPNVCASAILFDRGDAVKVCYLHHLDQLNRGVAVGEIVRKFSTNESTLTVGCSYAIDPHRIAKAKLNNHGHLSALIQHELKPKSILTISGSFDTLSMEKTPRFEYAIAGLDSSATPCSPT